ncbi:hypothetical protein SDC9_206662 [bioreactor metagenome]|uniref:Uncharacterized protein n=1 Tax=bioreactor metagenome TaxID=1076179 RepID=A0A645J664_9ZZZZ
MRQGFRCEFRLLTLDYVKKLKDIINNLVCGSKGVSEEAKTLGKRLISSTSISPNRCTDCE